MPLPEAFLQRTRQQLGDEFEAFVRALDGPPPVSIRLHPRKKFSLPENTGKVKWCPGGLYLPERPVFTLDPHFHAGAYYVQEASSMFLSEAVRQWIDLSQPLRVLDLCAAPGGKTTLLNSLLPEGSLLLSNETIASRFRILKENATRWGYANTCLSQADPAALSEIDGFFDLVVVDAPCSGEGLFRKDRNARQEWSEELVDFCAGRQKRILTDALGLLAPGGTLVYCTCTYSREENEDNAHWLCEEMDLIPRKMTLSSEWGIEEQTYGYQLYPHRL
ncbi:MAG: RsmB/NOP family class I SAM-dependent RNA methyltransferase, partial [Saprospiraceae bacterium]|nr:RsmB/NOP family class I SAM-dependent RNA methyltransferase [Saprospiraceae bacterium]